MRPYEGASVGVDLVSALWSREKRCACGDLLFAGLDGVCGELYLLLPVEDIKKEDDTFVTFCGFDYGFEFAEAAFGDNHRLAGFVERFGVSTFRFCAVMAYSVDYGVCYYGRLTIKLYYFIDSPGGADNAPVGLITEVNKQVMGEQRFCHPMGATTPCALYLVSREEAFEVLTIQMLLGAGAFPGFALDQVPGFWMAVGHVSDSKQ